MCALVWYKYAEIYRPQLIIFRIRSLICHQVYIWYATVKSHELTTTNSSKLLITGLLWREYAGDRWIFHSLFKNICIYFHIYFQVLYMSIMLRNCNAKMLKVWSISWNVIQHAPLFLSQMGVLADVGNQEESLTYMRISWSLIIIHYSINKSLPSKLLPASFWVI